MTQFTKLLKNKQYLFILWISIFNFIIPIFFSKHVKADSIRDQYYLAETIFNDLKNVTKEKYNREKWLFCINEFNKVHKLNPNGSWAAAGLYKSGLLYMKLYEKSRFNSDISEALDIFQRIIKRYPNSLYGNKAKSLIEQISEQNVAFYNNCSKEKNINKHSSLTDHTFINDIRISSKSTSTRLVIEFSKKISFKEELVTFTPKSKKNRALHINLYKSKIIKKLKEKIGDDGIINKKIRIVKCKKNQFKIIIDMNLYRSYNLFILEKPFRIVIDLIENEESSKRDASKGTKVMSQCAIVQQLGLGVSKIVIDPGHGGKDFGALGALEGFYEKDITLQIANRLAKKIKNELNCDVVLTREKDCFISLEERTSIANEENADLFVSIHTNAAENKNAFGIETFFLNLATDNETALVAIRENETSNKNISDMESILINLINNAKIVESNRLASSVQKNICSFASKKYDFIVNKGVKQAPFYVLLGAQMPAILIETSFISNHRECSRLGSIKYQETICDGIIMGIKDYIKLSKN